MKRFILLFLGIIATFSISAQTSDYFNYQAIISDGNGNPKVSTSVTLFIEIIQGSINGTVSFSETQTTSTNTFGAVNLKIGSENPTGFAAIDWSNTPYFIRISVNGTVMGSNQLLSVPFALHAKKADTYTETDPMFLTHPSNGIGSTDISNWNTSYSWGNHTGLYKAASYLPEWSEITNNPFNALSPTTGDMLYYNGASWASIPKGTDGQVLIMNASGSPEWQTYFGSPVCSTQNAVFNLPSITLNGIVNPHRFTTTVTFEYGVDNTYGSTATAIESPVSGSSNTNVSTEISGLTSGITYHFRVKAVNAMGTSYGDDMTFNFLAIGGDHVGGLIFYLDASGQHGLVAAKADQTTSIWGCYLTAIPGADGTTVGTGNQNTTDIINGCVTAGIAARVCRDYAGGGFTDWFLPSKDELDLMFTNLKGNGYGAFNPVNYWSSSESSSQQVHIQRFSDGLMGLGNKTSSYNVRAARAF